MLFDLHTDLGYLFQVGVERASAFLSSAVLLPRTSRKRCGDETRFLYQLNGGTEEVVSLEAVLRLYYRTGARSLGCNEVRASWRYNDLKPRTFYALGGHGFFSSAYMKTITNMIVDILPCTNRFTRFGPHRLTRMGASIQLYCHR